MEKINLKGISKLLRAKELKNIMGGSNTGCSFNSSPCTGECTAALSGKPGYCGTYIVNGSTGFGCFEK